MSVASNGAEQYDREQASRNQSKTTVKSNLSTETSPAVRTPDPKTPSTTDTITNRQTPTFDLNLKSQVEDNILSTYENVAYNFRLFMTDETANYETMPHENVVVIAETGVTGFNITETNIDTIISPSRSTKNTFATYIEIKIIEPFGTSLFDYIRNAALELDVKDHRRVPLWLELKFKGYTDGLEQSYEGGDFADLSKETRLWRIIVKNVDVEMDLGGTHYTMHCIAQDEQALDDASRYLPKEVNIKANTLGDFFRGLSLALNEFTDYKTTIQDNKVTNIRRYVFTFPEDPLPSLSSQISPDKFKSLTTAERQKEGLALMRDWKIRGDKQVDSVRTEAYKDNEPLPKVWQFHFDAGTSIEAIIHQVIGSTKEGQSLLNFGEPGKSVENDADSRDPVKPSIAFVVQPTVELLTYNAIAKAYNIEITYNIRQYKTFAPIISQKQVSNAQSPNYSKQRLQNKIKVCNLKKHYSYMFTGENTEILDYKVELNSAWFVSIPIFRGQARGAQPASSRYDNNQNKAGYKDQIDSTKDKPDESSNEALIKKIRQQRDDLSQDADEGFYDPERVRQNELTEARALEQAQIPLRANQNGLNTLSYGLSQKRISIANDFNVPQNDTTRITPNVTVISTDPRTEGVKTENKIYNQKTTGSIYYAEDFDQLSDTAKSRNIDNNENSQINNVSVQVSPTSASIDINTEGTKDANRSFFTNSMNQLFGFKGQMINLNMEIKGDPYWLGQPDPRKRLVISTGFDDLTSADSLILLTFKFPVAISDGGDERRDKSWNGTGEYELRYQENGFNGLYSIVKVENSFSHGKFTQKLTGYIDPLTKEQDLLTALI